MKQVKLLWGAVSILSLAVIVLLYLYLRSGGSGSSPGTTPQPDPASTDPAVARAGNVEIRSSTLRDALMQKEGDKLLSQMLDHTVTQMEADEQKLKVTSDEIDAELKRMQQGYASEDEFYRSMKEQLGMTKDEIREDAYYKLLLEKIATQNITISAQDIDSYISSHPEEFKNHVQLHIQQIINQTLAQANRTVELAQSGQDFAQLAKDRSIDTATANDGGDLGWLEDDDPFVPKPVMKAAAAMKPGEVSGPIQLDNGSYAVIKLAERKEQPRGTEAEIRETVRKQLALQEAPSFKDVLAKLWKKWNVQIMDPQLQTSAS